MFRMKEEKKVEASDHLANKKAKKSCFHKNFLLSKKFNQVNSWIGGPLARWMDGGKTVFRTAAKFKKVGFEENISIYYSF